MLSILMGGRNYLTFKQYISKHGVEHQRSIALSAASLLINRVDTIRQTLERVANDPTVDAYRVTFNRQPLMARFSKFAEEYIELEFIRPDGSRSFKMVKGTIYQEFAKTKMNPFYKAVKNVPNQMHISNVRFSPEGGEMVLDFAYNRVDYFDQSSGTVVFSKTLNYFRGVINDVDRDAGTDITITDGSDRVFFSTAFNTGKERKATLIKEIIAQFKIQWEKNGETSRRVDPVDAPFFVSCIEIPEINWKVFVSTPMDQMLKPLRKLFFDTVVLTIIVLIGALMLTMILIRSVITPINLLTQSAVKAIENIDTAGRVKGFFDRELQGLVATFNNLLDSVQSGLTAIRDNESQLKQAQKLASVGTLVWSPDTNEIQCSDQLRRMLKFSPADKDAFLNHVHPDEMQYLKSDFETVLKGNKVSNKSCRFILPGKEPMDVQYNLKSIPGQDNISHVVIGTFQDITELKSSHRQMDYLAYHDNLTGLPNRRYFNERLEHVVRKAQASGSFFTIMFIDLDHFKNINDSFGHSKGDDVLQKVAQRLQRKIREGDTLARLGGDEFIILSEAVKNREQVKALAKRILRVFHKPVALGTSKFKIHASIGISLYPFDGDDVNNLVKNADAALYFAKEHGRNTFQFYREVLTKTMHRRVILENMLYNALQRKELHLFYQPQIDTVKGCVSGFEVLLRWHHPEEGFISPAEFIPLAESSGLILPIGRYVLEKAFRQAASWRDSGYALVPIAINVSGQQINLTNIAALVDNLLEQYRLDPGLIELEITEGYLINRQENVLRKLNELKALGISLAIDDFGTGYSSLSYLKDLPVDKLKLDQSFVRGLPGNRDDRAIADAIITLGHNMGMGIIAEGVETQAQKRFLTGKACDVLQGYLFSPPVPVDEAEIFLTQSKAFRSNIIAL